MGWCGCGEDCKEGGKLWGALWLADKERGKAPGATDGGGWWGRWREGVGGPWGLEPGVLLLLLLCPLRLRPL